MDRLSRRSFLGQALVAGVGATIYRPHVAIASPAGTTLAGASDPDFDPGFIAGKIIDVTKDVVSVLDYDDQLRSAHLTPTSEIWKKGVVGVFPPSVGDCVYARGLPGPDGSVDIDYLWVDIVSVATEVLAVNVTSFEIRLPSGEVAAVLVTPSTQVETPDGEWVTGGVDGLKPVRTFS